MFRGMNSPALKYTRPTHDNLIVSFLNHNRNCPQDKYF